MTTLFGLPVASLTPEEAVGALERGLESGHRGQYVVTLNVDILITALEDPSHFQACQDATLIVADGMPLVWVSGFLGSKLKGRVNGADLAEAVVELAARKGYRLFLLGGAPSVPQRAARALEARFPDLIVAGAMSPPVDFERDPSEVERTVDAVRRARADIVLVGLGAPKQEIWMHRNLERCGVALGIGVGGTFNFWIGDVRRAPRAFQRIGLEWLWRLWCEPRRLWRRYLVRDMRFFPLVLREAFWRLVRPSSEVSSDTYKAHGRGRFVDHE